LEAELIKTKEQASSLSGEDSVLSKRQSTEKPEKLMAQAIDKELERAEKRNAELQSRYELLQREKEEITLKW